MTTQPQPSSGGRGARLGALAVLAVLVTALAACVLVQSPPRAAAVAAREEAVLRAQLEASKWRALRQAYADGDWELADSLERLCSPDRRPFDPRPDTPPVLADAGRAPAALPRR